MGEWAIRVKDLRKQYPGRNGPVHAVQRDRPGDQARRVLRLARPQRRGQDDHRRDPRGPEQPDVRRGGGPGPGLAHRRGRHPRADRRHAPGNPVSRQGDGARDRLAVSELLQERHEPRRRDRARLAREQGERLHRAALRRPAATAGGRDRPGRRPRDSLPGRADDRTGPAIAPPALGGDSRPARSRPHRRA